MIKSRYLTGLLGLSLSLTVLLAACCPGGTSTPTPAVSPSASPEDTAAPSASPVPSAEPALFTPGTWLSDGGQYYFFDEGGATGRTASLEDGTGVGFSYTLNGAEAAFSMGAADSSSPCTVSRDGDTITLEWEDGTTEHLTYVSAQGSDAFRFYSNQYEKCCDRS